MPRSQSVTIYFNDIDIDSKPYRVFEGCPSVTIAFRDSIEYADKRISTGEWSQYVIPELTGAEVIFE